MSANTAVLDQGRDTPGIWVAMTGLSILCHVLLVAGVIFLPQLQYSRTHIPSVVSVDLVSLPTRAPEPQSLHDQPPSTQAVPASKAKPAKQTIPAIQPDDVKEKKALQTEGTKSVKAPATGPGTAKIKKSLKKKSYDPSRAIKGAIARIEKGADQSRPSPVREAIGKLKKQVLNVKPEAPPSKQALATGKAGSGAGDKKGIDLIDIYNAEIWDRIRKNWAFSAEIGRGHADLEATIIVKIMREGMVRDIWFEKRSGNSYFDDSVFKAVKKSTPLPPLPEAYLGSFYEVGFRFNLSELQGGD